MLHVTFITVGLVLWHFHHDGLSWIGLFIRSLRSRNKLATLSNALLQAEKKETDLALREAQRDIELKNKELASSALHITRNSNMVAVIIKELESIQMKHDQILIQRLIKLVKEIEGSYDKDAWSEFELRFNTVYEAFYTVLQEKFPDLSPAEKRLSALLRYDKHRQQEIGHHTAESGQYQK